MISEAELDRTELFVTVAIVHVSKHEHNLIVTSNGNECVDIVNALLMLAVKTSQRLPNVDTPAAEESKTTVRYSTKLQTRWTPFHR